MTRLLARISRHTRAQSVSAIFEYDYAASLDAPAFVHLQFISWIDGVGDWRAARCVTLRVATTSSAVAYARAVHAPTASLLAARLLVVEALREEARRPGTSASRLRRRCDARVEKRVASVAEAFDAGGAFPEGTHACVLSSARSTPQLSAKAERNAASTGAAMAAVGPEQLIGQTVKGWLKRFQDGWGFMNSDAFVGDLFVPPRRQPCWKVGSGDRDGTKCSISEFDAVLRS